MSTGIKTPLAAYLLSLDPRGLLFAGSPGNIVLLYHLHITITIYSQSLFYNKTFVTYVFS